MVTDKYYYISEEDFNNLSDTETHVSLNPIELTGETYQDDLKPLKYILVIRTIDNKLLTKDNDTVFEPALVVGTSLENNYQYSVLECCKDKLVGFLEDLNKDEKNNSYLRAFAGFQVTGTVKDLNSLCLIFCAIVNPTYETQNFEHNGYKFEKFDTISNYTNGYNLAKLILPALPVVKEEK